MTGAPEVSGTWVALPTYDEAENLPNISAAILEALPAATLLVVDDASPDGTGELADRLAESAARIRVRPRAGEQGLGRAYPAGVRAALHRGAETGVPMVAAWSREPAALPA